MQLGYDLKLLQKQKLMMTPELRQGITILQMSTLDLNQFIAEQLVENPLLERPIEEGAEDDQRDEQEESFDIDWQEYFQDSSDLGYQTGPQERRRSYDFQAFTAKAPNLAEHLSFQLAIADCPPALRPLVAYLIGNLDGRGYLMVDLQDAAHQMGAEYQQAVTALGVLQAMEPPGVGARNLAECLLLQIKHLGLNNPMLEPLINEHLADVASGRYRKIASQLGVTVGEVQEAVDDFRALDPKPARNFSGAEGVRYIVPDVTVEKVEGEYIVLVNDISTPRLRINNTYRRALTNSATDGTTRKYIEGKLNAAVWLMRGIEQRRLTLYRVARALVELQADFLEGGARHLKPLILQDVAAQLDVHQSTISRATANKYMQTPQGVFEMKYFFSTAVQSSGGTELSSTSIKQKLRELVAGENPQKPLSDQKIADALQVKGIKISRRTVTKYRNEQGILAASLRKRH